MKDQARRAGGMPPFDLMHVALLLLCAVVLTGQMVGGLYGAYLSRDSGSNAARVASFGALSVEDAADNNMRLQPGVNGKKQSTVTFAGSEMETYVFVAVTMPSGWKGENNSLTCANGKVTLKVDSTWKFLKNDEQTAVFYYQGQALAPNTPLSQVTVFADGGAVTVDKTVDVGDLAEAVGEFTVQATAVQSSGFADAAAAWASVSKK